MVPLLALTVSRDTAEWLVSVPLRIAVVVLAGVVAYELLKRLVHRSVRRLSVGLQDRAQQRATTIAATLTSLCAWVLGVLVVLTVLDVFRINLAPFIAGASIAGVALGFGAQSLVRDCLAGLFLLLEDQLGVGDAVDLGEVTGTVEHVSLRVTRIRAADGSRWFVPNGEIKRVGNHSQSG